MPEPQPQNRHSRLLELLDWELHAPTSYSIPLVGLIPPSALRQFVDQASYLQSRGPSRPTSRSASPSLAPCPEGEEQQQNSVGHVRGQYIHSELGDLEM